MKPLWIALTFANIAFAFYWALETNIPMVAVGMIGAIGTTLAHSRA